MKKRLCFLIALILMLASLTPAFSAFAAETAAAGKVSANGSNLNIRAGTSTATAIVGKLADTSWITLVSKTGNWWRVRYGANSYGYCYDAYIVPRSGSYAAVVQNGTSGVNIYRGEGTSYEIKATLASGASVAVLTYGDTWCCILYNGTHKGYVQTQFLRKAVVTPVQLNVTRYAQTDARWKNVRIGTNGGTIGTIGCTTTCLAMTETYATGTIVTPAAMASRLTYSAGGSLTWPTNYTTMLANSSALSKVYELLAAGKPVIFGAKKANGTQHWVVVTGNDGSGLTPGAFKINDPGSAARKTLADFFAVYPSYYKLAWR